MSCTATVLFLHLEWSKLRSCFSLFSLFFFLLLLPPRPSSDATAFCRCFSFQDSPRAPCGVTAGAGADDDDDAHADPDSDPDATIAEAPTAPASWWDDSKVAAAAVCGLQLDPLLFWLLLPLLLLQVGVRLTPDVEATEEASVRVFAAPPPLVLIELFVAVVASAVAAAAMAAGGGGGGGGASPQRARFVAGTVGQEGVCAPAVATAAAAAVAAAGGRDCDCACSRSLMRQPFTAPIG